MSGDNSRASWVPVTPVKQNGDPICNYQQENQTIEPSNFVSGQICQENELQGLSQVSHVLQGTGFPDSLHGSVTNSVEATTEYSGTTFSMYCVDKSMPFCDLLALANAAAAKTASGSNNFVGSIPVTQFEGTPLQETEFSTYYFLSKLSVIVGFIRFVEICLHLYLKDIHLLFITWLKKEEGGFMLT